MEGYHLNNTGERVSELLSRQFVVPTLDSVPNEQTRNWIDGEYLVDCRIGELCRVKVEEEWVFLLGMILLSSLPHTHRFSTTYQYQKVEQIRLITFL